MMMVTRAGGSLTPAQVMRRAPLKEPSIYGYHHHHRYHHRHCQHQEQLHQRLHAYHHHCDLIVHMMRWEGDFYRGKNTAVATTNNCYLAGECNLAILDIGGR